MSHHPNMKDFRENKGAFKATKDIWKDFTETARDGIGNDEHISDPFLDRGDKWIDKIKDLLHKFKKAIKNGNDKKADRLEDKLDNKIDKLKDHTDKGVKALDDDDPDPVIVEVPVTVEVPAPPAPPLPKTVLNADLADEGINGSGNMHVGSGIPVHLFQKQQANAGGIDFEIALSGNYRQGDTVPAFSVDQHGAVHFDLPGGTQVVDPAHSVPVAHAGRSAASWNYSFTVEDGTIQQFLLENKVEMMFDIDPTSGQEFITLRLFYDEALGTGTADTYWATTFADGTPDQIFIADDGGDNETVHDPETGDATQNSQNWKFYDGFIDGDPNVDGNQAYDFIGEHDVDLKVSNIDTGEVLAHLKTVHHLGGYGLDLEV